MFHGLQGAMPQFLVFWIFLLGTQVAQALSITSFQPITVEIGFGDVLVTGVLDFANTQACSDTLSLYSRSAVPSLNSQSSGTNIAINQAPTAFNPISRPVTDVVDTAQVRPTNTLLTPPYPTRGSIAGIPTINAANSTNSSFFQPRPVFTSGSSGGRSGLLRIIEALRVLNR
ncbi:hypothetical protein VTK56DRAFT_4224 [Thermocarpiscus australiensis]